MKNAQADLEVQGNKMQEKYIRAKDVPKYLNCGKTKFYQLAKEPDFPKPIKIGAAISYVISELDLWMLSQRESA